MDYFFASIFALAQAVTEFAPISSSGHLVILHEVLPALPVDAPRFDVALHGGTLLAVVLFFYRDIRALVVAWLASIFRGRRDELARRAWLLLLATVPAALAGYWFESAIEDSLRSVAVVAFMLVAVGILFLVVEKFAAHKHDMNALRWPQALAIGCAQALALIPGTSRSGSTIIAGMAFGLKREHALRFSFLLSVPIILGANVKNIIPASGTLLTDSAGGLYAVGFIVSGVGGYIVITYLLKFVQHHSLSVFAYYRFLLAALLVLWQLA